MLPSTEATLRAASAPRQRVGAAPRSLTLLDLEEARLRSQRRERVLPHLMVAAMIVFGPAAMLWAIHFLVSQGVAR